MESNRLRQFTDTELRALRGALKCADNSYKYWRDTMLRDENNRVAAAFAIELIDSMPLLFEIQDAIDQRSFKPGQASV